MCANGMDVDTKAEKTVVSSATDCEGDVGLSFGGGAPFLIGGKLWTVGEWTLIL